MKCILCGEHTEEVKSRKVFFDQIIINPAIVNKCIKCGEEYTGEKEYERIRKKVEEIKKDIEPEAFKKIQFLVL